MLLDRHDPDEPVEAEAGDPDDPGGGLPLRQPGPVSPPGRLRPVRSLLHLPGARKSH